MTEPNDVQSCLDRMEIHMELRGLRPNTVSTFARCARRFLAHTDRAPADVTSTDVESFFGAHLCGPSPPVPRQTPRPHSGPRCRSCARWLSEWPPPSSKPGPQSSGHGPARRVVYRIYDGFWLAAPEPDGAFENGHLLVEGQRDGAVGTMTGVNEPIS
jgi:Phage integrase, N-terminal SAM-like domain